VGRSVQGWTSIVVQRRILRALLEREFQVRRAEICTLMYIYVIA